MTNVEPLKAVEGVARIAELLAIVPGAGTPFSIIGGVVRAGQGNFGDAAFDVAMAIPFAGVLGKVAKTAKVAEEGAEGAHVVYQGINPATKAVEYVGITMRDPAIRWAEHALDPEKAHLVFRLVKGANNLTKTEARVLEQKLINKHGLGNLLNKINSIAPKYWAQYGIKP